MPLTCKVSWTLSTKFRLTTEFVLESLEATQKIGLQYLLETQDFDLGHDYYVDDCLESAEPSTLLFDIRNHGSLHLVSDRDRGTPNGCDFLHEWICLLDTKTTDPYGWQYKSEASPSDEAAAELAGAPKDCLWTSSPVVRISRRRVWFRTYCPLPCVAAARKRLSLDIQQRCRGGESLRGELSKRCRIDRVTWRRHHFILTDNSLDYYLGQPSAHNKHRSIPLTGGFVVRLLHGSQCPGHSFAFLIEHPEGLQQSLFLKAESERERNDWTFHLSYVLALLSPNLCFSPLPSAPPPADSQKHVAVLRGDLWEQGRDLSSLALRHCELTQSDLHFYDGCEAKTTMSLLDAILTDADANADAAASADPSALGTANADTSAAAFLGWPELEFSIKSSSNQHLRLRCNTTDEKHVWLAAISDAITRATAIATATAVAAAAAADARQASAKSPPPSPQRAGARRGVSSPARNEAESSSDLLSASTALSNIFIRGARGGILGAFAIGDGGISWGYGSTLSEDEKRSKAGNAAGNNANATGSIGTETDAANEDDVSVKASAKVRVRAFPAITIGDNVDKVAKTVISARSQVAVIDDTIADDGATANPIDAPCSSGSSTGSSARAKVEALADNASPALVSTSPARSTPGVSSLSSLLQVLALVLLATMLYTHPLLTSGLQASAIVGLRLRDQLLCFFFPSSATGGADTCSARVGRSAAGAAGAAGGLAI